MTVYVDDMYLYPVGEYKRDPSGRIYKMSHMIADTREELIAMVKAIGVQTRYLQHKGGWNEHFDIAMTKRELAVAAGAVQITMRQCSAMCMRRRVTGALGVPADAERWHAAHAASKVSA